MNAPLRLLVVDDDADLTIQIRLMLQRTGRAYEVDGIARPASLSERLDASGYDAILLDHHLMFADGISVLRALHADPMAPPAIILTMSQDPALPDTYLELGAADFLAKDEITPGLLDRTIRYAVAQWRTRRDLERGQQAMLRNERLATIGRIATGVAHEYNNLNAVILAGIELLARRLRGEGAAERQVARVLDSLERSRRISQSLLQLGRTRGGNGEIIDLRRRISDSLALLQATAAGAGVALRAGMPSAPCPVRFDAGDAHQVLANLVINAIHALHARPEPVVQVRLAVREGRAELAVSDNGVGIAAVDLPHIFEPFFSRKGPHDHDGHFARDVEGSGLGLSVCQSLVERAGGSIAATSVPGQGTTVTITLPIAIEPPAPSPAEVAVAVAPGRRLAIVDDNAELVESMGQLLNEHGFSVESFTDPTVFIAEPGRRFDAVLIDWRLPGMTGDRVLDALADPGREPPLPVVFLSGDEITLPPSPPGTRVLGFLAKPFPVSRLLQLLAH